MEKLTHFRKAQNSLNAAIDVKIAIQKTINELKESVKDKESFEAGFLAGETLQKAEREIQVWESICDQELHFQRVREKHNLKTIKKHGY